MSPPGRFWHLATVWCSQHWLTKPLTGMQLGVACHLRYGFFWVHQCRPFIYSTHFRARYHQELPWRQSSGGSGIHYLIKGTLNDDDIRTRQGVAIPTHPPDILLSPPQNNQSPPALIFRKHCGQRCRIAACTVLRIHCAVASGQHGS